MWKGVFAFGATTAVVLALFGCADDPVRPPVSGDAPNQPGTGSAGGGGGGGASRSDAAASDDDGGDGGTCSTLTPGVSAVDQLAVAGDPPPAIGGAILDGAYDLVEARVYLGLTTGMGPGLTGSSYRGSLQITRRALERTVTITNSSSATSATNQRGTLIVAGTNGTLSFACPVPLQEQVTYSVLNSGASLTITNLVTKEAYVFTRRS